jgi:hypothetical protein
MLLNRGLKEWAVAITALAAGETIVLLRKGGIREQTRRFAIAHTQVWLYPTYEHQQPHLLKAPYANQVEPVASGWHPTTVSITTLATITAVAQITAAEDLWALQSDHIWQEAFVQERFQWKPQAPLSVLFLQVATLPQPEILPYDATYGGCRSWLELAQAIETQTASLVMPEMDYQQRFEAIRQRLSPAVTWLDLETSEMADRTLNLGT